jgi:hypothetical protein
MVVKWEYDRLVRRLNPATVAVLALVFMIPAAPAQLNPGPPSVTSNGFGGSTGPRGMAPSVTSIGFGAPGRAAPMPPSVTSPGFSRTGPGFTSRPNFPHHEHANGARHGRAGALYAVPYYYPYAYDSGESYATDDPAQDEDEQYQGGPTIFDRRGPGTSRPSADDYAERHQARPSAATSADAVAEDEPVSAQPDTLLVFKDGHQLEISNYAIVGTTLFDLTEGHHQKIPLSDLNLTATAKENDERGIDFRLPLGFAAN